MNSSQDIAATAPPDRILKNQFVCQDCGHFLANGDTGEIDANTAVRVRRAVAAAQRVGEHWYLDSGQDAGFDIEFSRHACSFCRSPSAGFRFAAVILCVNHSQEINT